MSSDPPNPSTIQVPTPLPFHTPVPFVAVPDIRFHLWTYRVLRSLQSNRTGGHLLHAPYYRPFSSIDTGHIFPPFLIGADHLFEWRRPNHGYPIYIVHLSINPLLHFTSPQVHIGVHFTYHCPLIHILYWHCPQNLPSDVSESLRNSEELFQQDLSLFTLPLQQFTLDYYAPHYPQDHSVHSP